MKWSYKTIHFALKKEGLLGAGFLDETEIEQVLNEYGRSGWEIVSVLEVQDGIIAIFKQPLDSVPPHPVREVEKSRESAPEEVAEVRDYSEYENDPEPETQEHGGAPSNTIGEIKIE